MDKKREALEAIISKSTEIIPEKMHNNIPKTGKCDHCGTRFDIPDTENEGFLSVECDPSNQDLRLVKTLVHRKGSQYATMHIHFTGTFDEVLTYLSDKRHEATLVDSIIELSESIDNKDYPLGR